MESEVSVSFTLTGVDLDPEEVTRLAGLRPTKTWRLGDVIRPPAILRYRHSGWRLKSALPPSASLREHLNSLLGQLEPSWEVARQLGRRYYAEIACVVYSRGGDRPEIRLDAGMLEKLTELNAALDIDLYVLPLRHRAKDQARESGR